jgi:hypothetical protein
MISLHGYKEVYNDYKKVGILLASPRCSNNCKDCQNHHLKNKEPEKYCIEDLINEITNNKFVKSVIFGGLDCFDSFEETLVFIKKFRENNDEDIVLYTGKTESSLQNEIKILKKYKNILIKFGEYNSNLEKIYDEIGGIWLASSNQYFKKIS